MVPLKMFEKEKLLKTDKLIEVSFNPIALGLALEINSTYIFLFLLII